MNFGKIFIGCMLVTVLTGVASVRAATSDGCDKEENDRITAELALCSTHAYNIGLTDNTMTDSDRQLMREVVALKTTVMTQQMYKQYEYLDATVKRLKTQLEKAILTTKLQAAGAATTQTGTTGASAASASNNRNVALSGAYDCMAEGDPLAAYDCLKRNMTVARNAVANGNMGDVKRQLIKDFEAFTTWTTFNGGATIVNNLKDSCDSKVLSTNRDTLNKCINAFGPSIALAIQAWNNINKPQTNK